MPPQVLSDSDSDGDVIPAKSSRKVVPVDDEDVEDVVEEDEEDEEIDDEEFVVEAIKDHKYEGKVRRAEERRRTLTGGGMLLLTDNRSI